MLHGRVQMFREGHQVSKRCTEKWSAQQSQGPMHSLLSPKSSRSHSLSLHGSDFSNTLIHKSGRVLISFWEAVPELCRLQFISPRESHTGALARESGRLTDLLFEGQKATLLSQHVCGPALLLGIQAKMKSQGSVLLLRQSSSQHLGKGFATESPLSPWAPFRMAASVGLSGGRAHPPTLRASSEPFIALVSPSHTPVYEHESQISK